MADKKRKQKCNCKCGLLHVPEGYELKRDIRTVDRPDLQGVSLSDWRIEKVQEEPRARVEVGAQEEECDIEELTFRRAIEIAESIAEKLASELVQYLRGEQLHASEIDAKLCQIKNYAIEIRNLKDLRRAAISRTEK